MTDAEFKGWMAVTEQSKHQWIQDPILWHNRRDMLLYKGGSSGRFILIENDGNTMCGTYEGAYPHIGEAEFKAEYSSRFGTQPMAIANLKAWGGETLRKVLK